MDLYQLRTFVAIAEEGHLTRASERLHISQPTASAHVRALEDQFGTALFVRKSAGVELTNAGQLLLGKAREVLAAANDLETTARGVKGVISGSLRIGTNADPALSRIGKLAVIARERFPLLTLKFEMRPTSGLPGIRNGELDAAFFIGDMPEGALTCLHLLPLKYCIVGPVAWKDAILKADWNGLARMPWILTRTQQHSMLMSLMRPRGLEPYGIVETDNEVAMRTMVTDGAGLSILRSDHAEQDEKKGLMVIAPVESASTQLLFACPKAREPEPLMQALRQCVDMVWSDVLGAEQRLAPSGKQMACVE